MADKRIFQLDDEGFLDDLTDKVYMWLDKKANEGEPDEPSWKFKANVFLKILNNFATKFVPNVLTVEGKCYWHDGELFVCNVAYTGDWVPGNFTATSIDALFARIADVTMKANLLGTASTDADMDSSHALTLVKNDGTQTKLPANLVAKASDVAALGTKTDNISASIAPEFDPTRTIENPYKAGESVTYTDGKVYTFTDPHYGEWTGTDVRETYAFEKLDLFIDFGDQEYIFSIVDKENHFLFGIKKDGGKVEWYNGIPTPIKSELSDLLKNIEQLLLGKVDKVDGKSLIDQVFAEGTSVVSNDEYRFALTDSEGKLLVAIDKNGYLVLGNDNKVDKVDGKSLIDQVFSEGTSVVSNDEYRFALTDSEGRLLVAIDKNGYLVLGNDNKVDKVDGKSLIDQVFSEGTSVVSNDEYRFALTDSEGRLLVAIDKKGRFTFLKKVKLTGGVDWSSANINELVEALESHGYKGGGGTGDWSKAESLHIPVPKCAIVNVSGIVSMPVTKTQDLHAILEFWDCDGNYFKKNVVLNAQGRSSMAFPKKNMTVDLLVDDYDGDSFPIKFGDWVSQDSFHMKAYFTDYFRCVCPVCYEIAELIYKDRGPTADAAWKLGLRQFVYNPTEYGLTFQFGRSTEDSLRYDTGARNHPLGFPVIVFLNGSFYGVYAWQLKKHRDNYNMKKNNLNEVHLDGILDNAKFWGGTIDWTAFEIRNPKSLKDIDGNKYDGDNPNELSDVDAKSAHVKAVVEAAADALGEIDDIITQYGVDSSEFTSAFEHYFDVDNLIDYQIMMDVTQNGDSFGNNWQWTTYDGIKWFVNPYDLDGSFGGSASGKAISASTQTHKGPSDGVPTSYLFKNASYTQRLKERYASLRSRGVITAEKIEALFDNWITSVGFDWYKKEMSDSHWGGCPCNSQPVVSSKWRLVLVDGKPVMGNYRTYGNTTTYAVGDKCFEGYGKAMGFYQFEAVEATVGESPIVSYGFKDNFYRLVNSIRTRLSDMDEVYEYNN